MLSITVLSIKQKTMCPVFLVGDICTYKVVILHFTKCSMKDSNPIDYVSKIYKYVNRKVAYSEHFFLLVY